MKNKLFTLLLLGSVAFGLRAENSTLDFTYAQGSLKSYGRAKKETVDVAICINEPALAGKKITGVKAYINPSSGISGTSVWLSKALTLENKINVPDICSVDATISSELQGFQRVSVLDVTFPEPYTLTGEPVYAGYSFDVDATDTDAQQYPIILSTMANPNPNGFFVHLSKSVLKWSNYTNQTDGVAYIVVKIEGDFPQNSASPKGYETIYAENGKPFQAIFQISNVGINTINSLSYSYKVDGSSESKQGSVTLETPLSTNLALPNPVSLNFEGISGVGPHQMELTITGVNGAANDNPAPSIMATVNVIPFIPVHRPLMEEYTGLWCTGCPRGYVAMEYVRDLYGDAVPLICYHNSTGGNDPMAVTTVYPLTVPSVPNSSIDRQGLIDPYFGSYQTEPSNDIKITRNLNQAIDSFTLAAISLRAEADGDMINVTSNSAFIQDIENANYQVGYVLTCNNLSNPTWGQINAYSGQTADWIGTPMEAITRKGNPIFGLVYNDVAIDVSGMMGVPGSLPSSLKAGEWYTHEFSFNIKGNKLVNDIKNLVVVGFVVDKTTGLVQNANTFSLDPSGVENITDDYTVVAEREFYDLSGRKVSNPDKGLYIVIEKLSDGSSRSKKVMF